MGCSRKIALGFAAAMVLLSGCAGSRHLHAWPEPAFQAQVTRTIPLGTPISEAETLLESAGYSCAFPQGPGVADPVLTCLDKGLPKGSLVERDWYVRLSHDLDGKVIKIDARISRSFAL